MKKRIISIAVSLCTVLSLFPVSAHAEEFHTPEPLYSNVGASVSGNESVSGNQSISGNNAQSIASLGSRVENVQAMLNVLPTVAELEGAEEATINAAYEAAQNVYDAIEELEPEEIALLTDMEKLSTLMDWFNGRVMTFYNTINVFTEEELKMSINSGMKIILDGDITLTNSLIISSDYPETIIQTNGYTLKGTIKLTKGTLIVEGVLDADIDTNSDNSKTLEGETYRGNISLNRYSHIKSGTYEGQITGEGFIDNGTFNNTVICNSINNGTFNETVTCDKIYKGVFNDTVTSNRVYDGEFYDVCKVSQGNNNGIEKGIFYKTPEYIYQETLTDRETSYYITYKDGDKVYATEYMLHHSVFNRTENYFTNPTKKNFSFDGWYKDSNFAGTVFDRNSLTTNDFTNHNLTLYAKWEHKANAHVDDDLNHKCDICEVQITGGYFITGDVLTIYPETSYNCTGINFGTITKIINYGTLKGTCSNTINKIVNYGTIADGNYPNTITIENKSDGTIENGNGTFYSTVTNEGTIKNGAFNSTVTNDGTIENGAYVEDVTNNGTIKNGIFHKDVTNNGTIKNGIFHKDVTNNGTIKNGIFYKGVTNNNTISGGFFYGTVTNYDTFSGGDFSGAQISGIYTVTFDSKGGSAVGKQWRAKAPATKPTDPTNGNKTFYGWFVKNNDESYSLYDFSANVTEDITLYANWDCELTGHIGGTATCKNQAVCTYCGKGYGSLNENNHALKHHQANAATIKATGNKEYWECMDCGKLFMDENGTNAAEPENVTIKKLPVMIEGMGQSINVGEKIELSFRSDAEFADFVRVLLDGMTVDKKNYTAREGSTIITLNTEYVASLPKGEHIISIVSTTGTASTSFTLLEESPAANTPNEPEKVSTPSNEPVVTEAAKKTSPVTGDDNNIALWIVIMIVGAFLMRNSEFGIRNYISDSGLDDKK